MMDLYKYQEIDSTNLEAERLLENGTRGDFIVLADTQSAGFGKDGRIWISPQGNLCTTIVKQIDPSKIKDFTDFVFLAAEAVTVALKELIGAEFEATYKFPNDILISGKKLCGILCSNGALGNYSYVKFGIGLNIISHPELQDLYRDENYQPLPATSLMEEFRKNVDPELLALKVYEALNSLVEGYQIKNFTKR